MSSMENPVHEMFSRLVASQGFNLEAERFRKLVEPKRLFPNSVDLDVGSPYTDELFAAALQAVTTAADMLWSMKELFETPWRGDGITLSDQVLLIAGGLWLHGPGGDGEIHHKLVYHQQRMVEVVAWQSLQGVIPIWQDKQDAPECPVRMVRGTLWEWSKGSHCRPILLRAAMIAARMAMNVDPLEPGERFWPLPEVPEATKGDFRY